MQHVTDCHVDPAPSRGSGFEKRDTHAVHLAVAGMGCINCANRVRNALLEVEGVVEVEVDRLRGGLTTVWCRPDRGDRTDDLTGAVAECGRRSHHRYIAVPIRSLE